MATDRWSTTFTVAASPATTYAHLTDPNNYVGLSPLVVAIRDVRPGTDAHGRTTVAYVAVERFRFARVLHWDNLIKVVLIQTDPGRELVSQVVSPGRVRLTAWIVVTGTDDATTVTETVEVSFPAVLRGLVTGQARSVAAYRAAELTRRMARTPAP